MPYLIPDDWDEESYRLMTICIPDSPAWLSCYRGAISELNRGFSWDEKTGSVVNTIQIAREAYRTLMSCDLSTIVSAIGQLTAAIQSLQLINTCCPETIGQTSEEAELDEGDVSIGPGEQFEDQEAYNDAKCNTANYIIDNAIALVGELRLNDVDTLIQGGVGIASGVIVTVLLANPVGLAMSVIIGLVSGIVGLMFSGVAWDLADLEDVLSANSDELKQALYCATSASNARQAISDILSGESLTTLELQMAGYLIPNNVLNWLFIPSTEAAEYAGSYNCGICTPLCGWIICPAGMVEVSGGGGFDILGPECATGVITNDGTDFTLSSVPATQAGGDRQVIALAKVEVYNYFLENGTMPSDGWTCECSPSGSGASIQLIGSVPTGYSHDFDRCLDTGYDRFRNTSNFFLTNPNTEYAFIRINWTGTGQRQVTFRVNGVGS